MTASETWIFALLSFVLATSATVFYTSKTKWNFFVLVLESVLMIGVIRSIILDHTTLVVLK